MAQKKEIKEQAKEQKRLAILLRTMVNGYMLEVNTICTSTPKVCWRASWFTWDLNVWSR